MRSWRRGSFSSRPRAPASDNLVAGGTHQIGEEYFVYRYSH